MVFLDCVGFIADYPAVSEALDVLGHGANEPCPLCFFRRHDQSGKANSTYGLTTKIHSSHPSFACLEERVKAMRDGKADEETLRSIGLSPILENNQFHPLSLHALSKALRQVKGRVPLTGQRRPVVPSCFDPY